MNIPLNVGIVLCITASSLLREVNRSDQSTVVHVQESVNTELQQAVSVRHCVTYCCYETIFCI